MVKKENRGRPLVSSSDITDDIRREADDLAWDVLSIIDPYTTNLTTSERRSLVQELCIYIAKLGVDNE